MQIANQNSNRIILSNRKQEEIRNGQRYSFCFLISTMAKVNKIYKFVSEEKFGSVDSSTSFPEILEECHLRKLEKVLVLILNFKNEFNWNFEFRLRAFSNNLEEQCEELLKSLIHTTSFDSPKYYLCIHIYLLIWNLEFQLQ